MAEGRVRHDDLVPARLRDLRGDRVRRRDARSSACARRRSSRAACGSCFATSAPAGERDEFHYEGGIRDFVAHVNEAKDPVHKHIVYFEGESDEGAVEVAMQWNTSYVESVFSFANNINTHRGRLAPLRASAPR